MTRDAHDPRPAPHARRSEIPRPLSRRDLLRRGAAFGTGGATLMASPAKAMPAFAPRWAAVSRVQGDPTTLTIATYGSPTDIDPHAGYDYRSGLAFLGAYEGLIALKGDQTDEYEGVLAESWEANADKSIWTFHLRQGVTFHDGSPVDAEAVRASFERLLTLNLGPVGILSRFVGDPGQITAPDPQTVVFDLGRPQLLFEAAIAAKYGVLVANTKVLKEHEVDGDWGHAWAQINETGAGTGPYEIVQFDPGEQLIMERNDAYWRGWEGNHFDRVIIRAVPEFESRLQLIERGEADVIDAVPKEVVDELQQNPDLVVEVNDSTQVVYVIMTSAGPFELPQARQAMCWAFPYDQVMDGVYLGLGKQAIGAVPETIHGFEPNTQRYAADLDKAKELLAQSGMEPGTTLTFATEAGDEQSKIVGQLFLANLQELGLNLEIQPLETTSFNAIFYGDSPPEERPNFFHYGWWPDYNDAWNHLYPQISCQSQGSAGANAGFYCNQRVEELMSQAQAPSSEEEYQATLSEIQQIIARDDPAAIYYVQPQWISVLRADVAGFVYNPIYLGIFDFWELSRQGS
jgi:peptide/nickel transport system substrate-binding protein